MAPEFSWMRRIVDQADLTDEILPGETIIEVVGEGRVLIEGHRGVAAYSDEEVVAKVQYGVAKIKGCNLKLTQMSANKLVITGNVFAVQIIREDGL